MTHASVFSGIGGAEVAASMLGWENLFHCEINPFGRRVLDYWYPNSKSYEDITRTDFTEWRGQVDVLTGGFPCQPFSYAGRRKGAEDDRYLWPSMYRAIDEIQPTWVVAENVAGILTMVGQGEVSKVEEEASVSNSYNDLRGRYELRETYTLQRICSDLESHGYAIQPVLIPACAVGAPHRRDRVFIVARQVASDTDSVGRSFRRCETNQRHKDRHNAQVFGIAEGHGGSGTTPHPDSHRGSEGDEHMESELADGKKLVSNGGQRNIAERLGRGDEIGSRWAHFPSVSPVHRRNDGIPFDVDILTIPFGQWRTESLKAYGNAIVPQVMYEIFRAIQLCT